MITVACVLKTGGDFDAEYVERLMLGVQENLEDFNFVCFTDVKDGEFPCQRIPLLYDLEGWWSKIELFRSTGKTLYIDLDTVITGSLQEIADYPHRFTMLNDVGRYNRPMSGMMAWQGDYEYLCDWFDPDVHIDEFMNRERGSQGGPWGDGGYISEKLGFEPELFQDLFPGQIVSFKWQTPEERESANVVCYHGNPRPRQTGWAA